MWTGTDTNQIHRTIDDIKAAERALGKLGRPFQLSVLGWRLGPWQDSRILRGATEHDLGQFESQPNGWGRPSAPFPRHPGVSTDQVGLEIGRLCLEHAGMKFHLFIAEALAIMFLAAATAAVRSGESTANVPQKLPLWAGEAPVGDGTFETNQAFLTVHLPARPANGAAVVICPGGGYGGLVTGAEGHGIAQWLNQHGIAGIVLEYRLPRGRSLVPLLDAQRALRTVRSRGAEWHIDPRRVGIMGFSAGGHLASTSGTHFDAGDAAAADPIARMSSRPDFMILVYPVITMAQNPERGTKKNLLGADPKPDQIEWFSNEKQVTAQTPPAFLAHALDDTVVLPADSRRFYEALKARQVPAEFLELPEGGHGLNGYQGPMWDAWQSQSLEFLAAQKIIPANDAQAAGQVSLSRQYPPESLKGMLMPRADWKPFPKFAEREAWQALPEEERRYLVQLGEQALAKAWPSLPATLYLEYARNGNRSRYEDVYFDRRRILQSLTLAECVEAKGRFLEATANALWAICEESTWCIPAHVGAQKAGVGLPDTAEPIVDLFAAETGVSVSWALYLLGPEWDKVSRRVRERAERELRLRILTPVVERDDFGWMALNVTRADRRPNNWTPWIAASVLTTALTSETEPARRLEITHKMLRSLDGFLKFYPADGGCDEGPGYWSRAGGSLLDCLDLLHSATGGQLDVFGQPLIGEIGRFISRAHIAGDYYAPIGDCAARMTPEYDLVFRYGQRLHDPGLTALAAAGASVKGILGNGYAFGRQIYAVFDVAKILALLPGPAPLARDVWMPSEDMQFMAARSQAGSAAGLYVAAWGAHNAQSHNHNDVGNFLVFARGQPVFIDVGAPTYTAQTFSSRRYDIWAFQSAYHNVPDINGTMQSAGRQFAAKAVRYRADDTMAEMQMDLASAYPPAAKLGQWLRTVRLTRGQAVEITEAFELKEIVSPSLQNLVTPMEASIGEAGKIRLHSGGADGKPLVGVTLEFDAEKLSPTIERIDLTDDRLVSSWGKRLNRILLKAKSPVLKDTWRMRVLLEP